MSLFDNHTREEHAVTLGQYLPDGPLFEAKKIQESNLFKFLFGLADTQRIVEENLTLTFDDFDFRTTEFLISQWESALGIPDSCFTGTGTNEQRRTAITAKFLSFGVQTEQDFIDIAALYGIIITIQNGFDLVDTFPVTFPFEFPNVKAARFTMIVNFQVEDSLTFPLTFPIPFGDDDIEILKCLFRKLAPANVRVIFNEV